MSVVRDHEDVLVIDTGDGRIVCEHQLVMDEGRTGREMVIAIHDAATASWPQGLSAADATALRDWITARLESGAIRDGAEVVAERQCATWTDGYRPCGNLCAGGDCPVVPVDPDRTA